MELCHVPHYRPQIGGNISVDLDRFGQSLLDDFLDIDQQVTRLNTDMLTFDALGKG
jgi:hypothetical protein